jgi:hypothetical protein
LNNYIPKTCLQMLSMHFFHPIQQCAQQIYLTALPLSPTSSHLQNTCLQNVVDNQLSHVTAFVGAPSTWGLLLRTIDTRPRDLTCITTSGQQIIAACEDIVNIMMQSQVYFNSLYLLQKQSQRSKPLQMGPPCILHILPL